MVELAYLLDLHLRNSRRNLARCDIVLIILPGQCSVASCPCITCVFIILRRRNEMLLLDLNPWAWGPLMLRSRVVSCKIRLGLYAGLRADLRVTVRLSMASERRHMLPRWRRLLSLSRSVGILGMTWVVSLARMSSLRFCCGLVVSRTPSNLLCICLVEMTLT